MATLYDLLRTHEGAGDPNTLFGHSQREGGAFGSTKVSEMNLGQLKDFSAVDGDYGRWVKNKLGELGHEPRVATPMGVGQIVGTTLRQTQKELGLPDDVLFDEKTQRMMINHLASKRINPDDRQATLEGLRQEWEGFKHVDDDDLWEAAVNFNGSNIDKDTLNTGKGKLAQFQFDMKDGSTVSRRAIDRMAGVDPSQLDTGVQSDKPQTGQPGINNFPLGMAAPQLGGQEPSRFSAKDASQYPLGSAPRATSTQAAAAEEEEQKRTLLDKIGAFIHPNAEDPTAKFKETLGGIGVGLGQMSAGQPVNLQPYFTSIANRKQASADARQALEQQGLDNYFKQQQLEVQQGNLEVAKARVGIDLQEAEREGQMASMPFSPDVMDKYADLPGADVLINDMGSADKTIRRQAAKDFSKLVVDNVSAGASGSKGVSDLMNAVINGETSKLPEIVASNNMEVDDVKKVLDAFSEPAALQLARALAAPDSEVSPEVKAELRKYNRQNAANITDLPPEVVSANMTEGTALGKELATRAYTASQMDVQLGRIEGSLLNLSDKGIEESWTNSWKTWGDRTLRGIIANKDLRARFEGIVGIDADEFAKQDSATKMLTLMATAPLMEGGGAISDSERATIATAVANESLSNAERLKYVWELQALNDMDRGAARYYEGSRAEDYRNYTTLRQNIADSYHIHRGDIAQIAAKDKALATVTKKMAEIPGGDIVDTSYVDYIQQFSGYSQADYVVETAPVMTMDEYKQVRQFLPASTDRSFYDPETQQYYYTDENGDIKQWTEEMFEDREKRSLLPNDKHFTENGWGRRSTVPESWR